MNSGLKLSTTTTTQRLGEFTVLHRIELSSLTHISILATREYFEVLEPFFDNGHRVKFYRNDYLFQNLDADEYMVSLVALQFILSNPSLDN